MIIQCNGCGDLDTFSVGLPDIEYPPRESISHSVIVIIHVDVVDDLHVFVFIHEEGDVKVAAAVEVFCFEADFKGVRRLGFERPG